MKKIKIPYICANELEKFALKIISEHVKQGSIIKKSLLLYEDMLIEISDDFAGNYFMFHFYINISKFEVSLTVAEVAMPFHDKEGLNNLYRITLRGLPKNHPVLFQQLVDINEQKTRKKRELLTVKSNTLSIIECNILELI